MPDIKKSRVLIIATDGFEQSELTQPRDALIAAGASTSIVGPYGSRGAENWRCEDGRLRRTRNPWWRHEPGQAAHRPDRNDGRQIVRCKRQSRGRGVPWAVAPGAGRRPARASGDLLQIDP